MQICLPLLVIVNILYAVYGCDPLIQSDQSLYCDAQFVFVGIVKYAKVTRDEAIFRIRVTSNLKGQIGYSGKTVTVFGSGLFDSCGPPSFKVNKKYILTVSKYSTPNRMMLGTYYEPTTANLNRFKKYDCSCKVEVNIPEQPFLGEPAPIGDKCVITERDTTVILTRATAPDDHLTVMDRGHLVNGLLLPHRVLNNQTDNIRLVEYYFTRIKRIA